MKTFIVGLVLLALIAVVIAGPVDKRTHLKDDKFGRKVKVAVKKTKEKDLKQRYFCNMKCENYCFNYACKCSGFFAFRKCADTCRKCEKHCYCADFNW